MLHSAITVFKGDGLEYYEYGNIEGRFNLNLDGFAKLFGGKIIKPTAESALYEGPLGSLDGGILQELIGRSMSNRLRYAFSMMKSILASSDEAVRKEYLYPARIEIVVWK